MNLKSFVLVTRNALLSELEYRFNYFMWALSSGISVAMESAILLLVLEGKESLGGFHREDLWRFVLLGVVVRSATGQWKVVSEALEEVREGGFRKYLLQPIHYPSYFIARAFGDKLGITLIFSGTLLTYKIFHWESVFLSYPYPLLFLISFFIANVLAWQIYLLMIYLAFWIDEVHFLQIAFNIGMGVFSGTLLPFQWLPPAVQILGSWSPLRYLGDFPVQTALGRISIEEFIHQGTAALGWVAILGILVWQVGVHGRRRYEAFGG